MNKIWSFGLIASLVLLIFNGSNQEGILEIASNSIYNSLKLCFELCLVYIFCYRILQIVQELQLHKFIAKKSQNLLCKIFPNSTVQEKEFISTSLSCNLLGLGNASLPIGIKAIEEMKKNNNKKSSNMFIILNCISLQIIPTTLMSIFISHGGQRFIKMWIISIAISILIAILSITLCKIHSKRSK